MFENVEIKLCGVSAKEVISERELLEIICDKDRLGLCVLINILPNRLIGSR